MDILRFTLSGKQAFFKNPEVNAYNYYTFGHVHKVALMGIFGAILGYGGYNQMKKDDDFPEFYKKLENIKISIVPLCKKGRFNKKIVEFNNSVGYAGDRQQNLIVKQQWLEEPVWNIYLQLDSDEGRSISDAILNHKCVYMPYLGSNAHPADITDTAIISGEITDSPKHIDSLYLKRCVEMDIDDCEAIYFKYEETLPIAMDKELNMYKYEKFAFSDMKVIKAEGNVYEIKDKYSDKSEGTLNIMFY